MQQKTELNKQITEIQGRIISNSKDAHFAKTLIEQMMSLKGQSDIVETELIVTKDSVVKTYDFGAYQFVRCKTCIIFKSTGYRIVIRPYLKALYGHICRMLDIKDDFDSLSDEEKEIFDMQMGTIILYLSLPLIAFLDEDFMFDVGMYILQKKNELYERLSRKPLHEENEEDMIANDEFRSAMIAQEEIKNEDNDGK